jgi:hypothetical protein
MLVLTGLAFASGAPVTLSFYLPLFIIALILGSIVYGIFLAWRGVVRSTRREELKPPVGPTPETRPNSIIDPRSVKGGRYWPLRILVVLAIASAGLSYFGSYYLYYFSPGQYDSFGQWLFIPAGLVGIASAEVVWEDAKAVNRALMENTIAAGWWSLFALVLAFIAVPIYTFDRRKNALSRLERP